MSRKKIIFLCFTIVIIFLLPDFLYWIILDHYQFPMRELSGDTSLYVNQLNSVIRHGAPTGNPYFWENNFELGRFFIFGKIVSLFTFLESVPIVSIILFLKAFVGVTVFILMARILKLFNLDSRIAYLFSFAFVLFYGPMTFKGGSALTNWYLPAFLGGLFLIIKIYKSDLQLSKALILSLLALGLFAFHPIYFSIGTLFTGIFWFLSFSKNPSRKIFLMALIWFGCASLIFYFLFLPFLFSGNALFSTMAKDMAFRNTLLSTHFPFLFLFGVRYLILFMASFYIYKKFKNSLNKQVASSYAVLLSLSLIAFLGLNSYIVTGKYFLNDHYPLMEDFIIIPLALVSLFFLNPNKDRFLKFLGIFLLVAAVLSVFVIWHYLHFKPVYFGRWVPIFSSYFILAFTFIAKSNHLSFIRRNSFLLLKAFLWISVLHAVFISVWDDKYWFGLHREVQAFRPLVQYLEKTPDGVVLANPYISNLLLNYTGHKVYWSSIAYHDLVATDELYKRWLVARLFFTKEQAFNGTNAARSVFGTHDNKCREFNRGFYLKFLTKVGVSGPYKAVCDASILNKWPEMELDSNKLIKEIKTSTKLKPDYKLDYLVINKDTDIVTEELVGLYFRKITDIGAMSVYQFSK